MVTALIGSDGPVLWLVAVLLLLAAGLAGALLVATRSAATPVRAGRRSPER